MTGPRRGHSQRQQWLARHQCRTAMDRPMWSIYSSARLLRSLSFQIKSQHMHSKHMLHERLQELSRHLQIPDNIIGQRAPERRHTKAEQRNRKGTQNPEARRDGHAVPVPRSEHQDWGTVSVRGSSPVMVPGFLMSASASSPFRPINPSQS